VKSDKTSRKLKYLFTFFFCAEYKLRIMFGKLIFIFIRCEMWKFITFFREMWEKVFLAWFLVSFQNVIWKFSHLCIFEIQKF
jgi:hypothetical protein